MLTTSEKEQIRADLGRVAAKGEVHIEVCPLCGSIDWNSTNVDRPDDVVVDMEQYREPKCRPCNRMRHFHPEVFAWVVKVLEYQRRVAKEGE